MGAQQGPSTLPVPCRGPSSVPEPMACALHLSAPLVYVSFPPSTLHSWSLRSQQP